MLLDNERIAMTSEEILRACCSTHESTRYSLQEPYEDDGYACATNMHICARCKGVTCRKREPGEARTPSMSKLEWELKGTMAKLPDVTLETRVPCACGGQRIKCRICSGSGKVECFECGHCGNCDECNGTGKIVCYKCDENHMIPDTTGKDGFSVGACHLAKEYIALLRSFGVTEVEVIDAKKPVHWRAGDVVGLLMPTENTDGDEK